ncbi:Ig-like domain-containing protein [Haloferula sp. BvORR071]|uniref:Ig-like domain-containing protein n=1 Tax=Haloferula sp. BvORR071 TaxID=1396141 RepID=UPI00055587F0|nr:Ig-like domain-containing protein [Haloferula sp. BvORR071]
MKFFLPLLLVATASAVPIQVTYTDAANTGFFDPAPRAATGSNPGTTLGQQRRIAFEYAASRWSSQIKGSIPIKVTAGWASTAPGGNGIITMASASPQNFFKNGVVVSGLPKNNTFYPSALVDQVMGQDLVLNGTSTDVSVNCNSYPDEITSDGFSWNYDLNNSGAGSSFAGAILHELAHGFGFIATLDQNGNYGIGFPTAWDSLMTDGAGTFLTTMAAGSRVPLRTSDDVFADGPTLRLYNNGNPAKVHAPATYSGGSSLHHFDETTYSTPGNINELQTPLLSFPTQAFGPLVTSAMRDMGYTMADELPPVADITSPAPGKIYTSTALAATGIFGTTTDTSADGSAKAVGLLRTKIALYSSSQGKWYRWSTPGFDSGTFNYANHTKEATIENLLPIATGSHTWRTALPAGLPDGGYELHVTSVDQNDQGSSFISNSFTIDNTAPPVVIEPWANNGPPIFNLDPLKILAPDANTLKVELRRTVGADLFFWSGTNWSTTPTQLAATQNAGRWTLNVSPPNRQNWPQGQAITIRVIATDAASNQTISSIGVTRTAADSSLPVVSFDSPTSGSVLTVPNLPSLLGKASDPESGIASVTLSIAHFIPGGGVEFWSGTDWSGSSVNLPVTHDPDSGKWTAPAGWNLPSAAVLPNGNYSIQVSATNREMPAGTTGAGVSFSVDHHPVYTWTGATLRDDNYTNDSRSWGVAENWSPYGVPDVNDKVVIANGDEVTSTISRSVYGLTLVNSYLNFVNGPGAFGTVTTSHQSEWSGGTLNGIWNNQGTLQLTGPADRWLGGGGCLNNSGTVSHNAGVIVGQQNATITNLPGATWILATAGDVFSNYNGGNQFINQGILRHTAANDSELNDWSYSLGGEVQKQGAVLVLRANATLPGGVQFTGAGGFRIADGTVSTSGSITNAAGLFQHAGGTLTTSAPLSMNGNFVWSGGAFEGSLTLANGSDLSITGACQLNTNSVFNNSGTVHWTAPSPLVGIQNATVNNQASGVWRLENTGDAFANYNGGNVFNNQGRLEKTGSGQTMLRNWTYSSPGEMKASTGQLYIAADWSATGGSVLSGTGTIEIAGGTWTFNGAVSSTVATLKFTGGTLSCGPTAKIQGNWIWNGGALSGSLEVPAATQLSFDGGSQLNQGATLVNKGTVLWQGTSPIVGIQNVAVTNAPGALWQIAATGAPFTNYNGGNSFTNQGTFRRTATGGDVTLHSWTYNQAASFESTGGGDTIINSPLNLLEGSSFNGAGKFILAGESWLKGACTLAGTIEHTGALHGEEAGQIKGTLRWVAGGMDGIVKVANLAYLRLSSDNRHTLGAGSTIDCSGSLVWEGGELQGIQNATLRIRNGAGMTIGSAAAFTNYNGGNHLVIDDGASLVKTSAGDSAIYWAFDNDGSAAVNNGMLLLFGGGSGDGSFTGNAPGVLRFANGGHVLEGGATLAGNVEITDGSLLASGPASGRLALKGGTAGGGDGGLFDFATGSTWTGGNIQGQMRIPTGQSLVVSSPSGKELTTGAVLEVQGLLQWDGGYPIQGHQNSTIDVKSNGTFRASADGDLFANYNGGNRLLLAGTFEKSGGTASTWLDEWAVEGNGTIRTLLGKTDLQTEAAFNAGTQFQGAGRTRFNGGNVYLRGAATIQSNVTVEFSGANVNGHDDGTAALNGGLIEWSGGTINGVLTQNTNMSLTGPGEKWLGFSAQLRNASQMTLGGTGILGGRQNVRLINLSTGTLNCPGSVTCVNYNGGNKLVNQGGLVLGNPLGRQTLHWSFQQTSSGSMTVELAGANAATPEFDCLLSHETVQLDGSLVVTKTGGYQPADGTTFDVVTGYGGVSGKFSTVLAADLKAEYTPGTLTLRASTPGITYGEWALAEGLSGANALATADPDGDKIPNVLEYAFHTNPKQKSPAPVTSTIETVNSQQWITLHYRRWQDRIDAGMGYYPERSADLATWSASAVDEVDPAATIIAGSEGRRVRILRGAAQKDFVRVRVE